MMQTFSKEKLINLLIKGDIFAFDTIYDEYFERLYCFVLKFLKHQEDAKEIVQDVFLKLWESRSRINNYITFESYLFTIAYNASVSELKKRANQLKYKEYLLQSAAVKDARESVNEADFIALVEHIETFVNKLPSRQREIFRLCKLDGFSYKEIAEQLHISENTVKNHLVAAMKYLRENLNQDILILILFFCLF